MEKANVCRTWPVYSLKKHLTPEGFGSLLYETIREAVASTEELAISGFLGRLGLHERELSDQYVGEIMVACMYGATLAIDRSTSQWTRDRIVGGMTSEFLAHLAEQGAQPHHLEEWKVIIERQFSEYGGCLEGYEGLEPPWKLGRQFLWHLTGRLDYVALSIKHATLYLLAVRDLAQQLLNEHGPHLDLGPLSDPEQT